MPVKAEYRQRGSVQYEFSTELLQTPIQLVKVTNLQTQIEAVLSHIVANNVERVHDDAPLRFWEFIQLLRMAKLEDLQMVWRQHKTNPAYRQWILDTLPSVGTPVALRFIIQRFEAAELSTVEVAQALIASVHMVTANHEAIQLFDSLRVNPKIKTNPVLNEIVLLGYGTMVSKYCADKPVCPVELVKPIHTLLAESVSKGETWQMISILKVLSNAGHPMSLKPITKVLPIHGTAATSLPTRVHAEAIMALRNIAKKEPRLVQEMALQLYMDKALHPELRMLACIVIFETRPAVGLVTSLANLLKMEENLQFHAGSSSQKSRSSASSFEAIYNKNKFLGTENAPAFAVILQAVRTDGKLQGYQITGYADKTNARLQLILAALAADNNWRLCADGVLLSKHKATAKIAWGQACKQYDLTVTAETGLLGPSPAARLRMTWNQLPVVFKRYAKKAYDYIPAYVLESFIRSRDNNSVDQLSFTVAATSERTLDLIFKTPTYITVLKKNLRRAILVQVPNCLLFFFHSAECSSIRDTVTTFNNRKYKNEMPQYCYQILAQDCSEEMKFMVLLRKDDNVHNHINVKIADIDIDLYLRDTNVVVKVNGREVPTSHLPYQHPTAKIEIRPNKDGISVYAPSLGLHEVYFDKNSWKIKVADWIKGQTCGLCGKADGEIRQEYRTSNGRVTKNAVSFAHSWVLPAENCRDTTGNMKDLTRTEFEFNSFLYCLDLLVCADAAVIPQDFYNYSVDMRETTQAHLACSCTPQCA
uniref:Uncharacterized protein n=1 Tax=Hippocampus comes TaxID=109280 RepID=A0A3Q2ZK41_HIPCM